jgi:hypothetical protein
MTAATADPVNLSPVQFEHGDLPAVVHPVSTGAFDPASAQGP